MELKLMSGTGNTFIMVNLITDEKKRLFSSVYNSRTLNDIASELCTHPLIDTDGIVFVVPSNEADFKWLFFNNDGSEAEMCGNAARCVTLFAHDQKIIDTHCTFETQAGVIQGEVLSPTKTRIQMTELKDVKLDQVLKDDQVYTKYDYIDSGVPHCVIKVNSVNDLEELRPLAKLLRKPNYFAPKGANITYRASLGKGHIESVSFERGVEDFTEACGTGAVAAAYSYARENEMTNQVQVSVPGGELTVEFGENNPYLIGDVKYFGRIHLDELKGEKKS